MSPQKVEKRFVFLRGKPRKTIQVVGFSVHKGTESLEKGGIRFLVWTPSQVLGTSRPLEFTSSPAASLAFSSSAVLVTCLERNPAQHEARCGQVSKSA